LASGCRGYEFRSTDRFNTDAASKRVRLNFGTQPVTLNKYATSATAGLPGFEGVGDDEFDVDNNVVAFVLSEERFRLSESVTM